MKRIAVSILFLALNLPTILYAQTAVPTVDVQQQLQKLQEQINQLGVGEHFRRRAPEALHRFDELLSRQLAQPRQGIGQVRCGGVLCFGEHVVLLSNSNSHSE